MFDLIFLGNNTFMIVKENEVNSKSYGFIKTIKLKKGYGISAKGIADEVYISGEIIKLEEKAIDFVKARY